MTSSEPASAVAGPAAAPVSKWRVVHGKPHTKQRPIALLTGDSTTTKIIGRFRALLAVGCTRNEPRVRFAYPVTVARGGQIRLSYRFDAKPIRTIYVRVRGIHRNVVAMEESEYVLGFLADMAGAKSLQADIRFPPMIWHQAKFDLFGADQAVNEALAPCRREQTARARRPAPASDDDERLADMIGPVVAGDD
jgi:hypothetical protein